MRIQKFFYLIKWRAHQLAGIVDGKGIKYSYYNGKRIGDRNFANEMIKKAIISEKPFMAARFGSSELYALQCVNDKGDGFDYNPNEALRYLSYNAGFFPNDPKYLISFSDVMKKTLANVDLLAIWYLKYEEYMAKYYGNNPEYCSLGDIEPFGSEHPWTEALEGKKVLVVHPFSETIQSQYRHRERLFANPGILPEFDLITYKAVQTIAGNIDPRFDNWFEALGFMSEDISKIDFDVAIIGCGAYGMPLAAKIKEMGKIAIHMGGATQLLFGIMGKRWESNETVKRLVNPYWVRPSEKPFNYDQVENGCYW